MKIKVLIVSIILFLSWPTFAQETFEMPNKTSTRWATAENWKGEKGKGGIKNGGRKGSACFKFKSGESQILAEASNTTGIVRRIWMTMNPRTSKILKGIQLEMYWDGAIIPAVSVPLGDFFNQGLGEMKTFENDCFSSPEGRSLNCFISMPFRKGMKILIKNQTDENVVIFYEVDYTLGDKIGKNAMYLHAKYNEAKTNVQKDYEILPQVDGKGRFLGANISFIANQGEFGRAWWGEGEVKIYLDGDKEFPTLCGTGTEDYIGTGWGQGEFSQRYQGCTIANGKDLKYAFYRYHIPDPVYFYSNIRVTIQQIGGVEGEQSVNRLAQLKGPIIRADEKGEAVDFNKKQVGFLFERSDFLSSCAYFYLKEP